MSGRRVIFSIMRRRTALPLVSVIMPAYNAKVTIGAAINSLQAQSFTNFELIVVDDGSTDGTCREVERLAGQDSRICLLRLTENSGSPAAPRNEGLRHARGRYIAFLDADDKWKPRKLERQVAFMEATGACISCTGYDVYNDDGKLIGYFVPPEQNNYEGILRENTIGCLTAMLDSRQVGPIEFPICGHEDYALWLSLLRRGGCVHGLQERLADYRVSRSSVSGNKAKVLKYFWRIYREVEKFSVGQSGYYCLRYAWNARNKYKNLFDGLFGGYEAALALWAGGLSLYIELRWGMSNFFLS